MSLGRAVLLPAAGASARMRGRDKLLEDVDGLPCLRAMAQRALASADLVICTLPALEHPRAKALKGLELCLVPVQDAAEGMAASLRAGAAKAAGYDLMVLPADMPALEATDLKELWEVFDVAPEQAIVRAATEDGRAGHPVIFSETYLPKFTQISGDGGAAPILQQHADALRLHPLRGSAACLDLDTPEDWAAWRRNSPATE